MRIKGALIRERGVRFAIVVVKRHILNSQVQSQQIINSMMPVFGVPVVLMAQNHRGVPTYKGRRDLVRFLSRVPMETIPWREFTVN